MSIYSCDIEANGLLDEATKLHCLSVRTDDENYTYCGGLVRRFFDMLEDSDTLVWHNGFGYDLPLLVKLGVIKDFTPTTVTLLDGTVKNVQLIDSLALSREFHPDKLTGHGLEAWSKQLGTHKPEINDWHNLPIEEYISRCENDVITTEKVFLYLCEKLGINYE